MTFPPFPNHLKSEANLEHEPHDPPVILL